MASVPPTRDAALNDFSANFDARITAAPTVYGLVAADATAFHALADDYATRLSTATNPTTRTKGTIAAKRASKNALLAKARQLINIINAHPGVTDAQRADLGLNPRDVTPSPVPVPATKPVLAVDPDGTLRLADETTPSRRARPPRTVGALVFTKIAEGSAPPPVSPADATFAVVATRSPVVLPIPAGSNGKTLWVLARWFNERGAMGPVSAVASTSIAA